MFNTKKNYIIYNKLWGNFMNINLDLIKTFSVVAKYQNITKASEILITTQPAVSKAIKYLENQLNCNLFIRSKKGVKLC